MTTTTSPLQNNESRNKLFHPDFWYIHGKKYDFSSFIDHHPGGTHMIALGKGRDCTELFESIHVLSTNHPNNMLSKFEVEMTENEKTTLQENKFLWEKGGFYDTVANRVKLHLINKDYKATWDHYLQIILLFFIYIISWSLAITTENLLYSVISGTATDFILFSLMHDASHGSFSKSPKINYYSTLWASYVFWSPWNWLQHHVYSHHSFTGIFRLDPDIVNATFWVRKHEEAPKANYMKYQHFYTWLALGFLPGQHFGQALLYVLPFAKKWRRIFNNGLDIPKEVYREMVYNHIIVTCFSIFVHIIVPLFIVKISIFSFLKVYLVHWIFMGLWYFLAVAPNHDQEETLNNNENNTSASGQPKIKLDWGEQQVRASGNHSVNPIFFSILFNFIFGGLNYQIEHHLFPSVNHRHFPSIAPIVQQTCEEFKIPYNGDNSFFESLQSYQSLLRRFAIN